MWKLIADILCLIVGIIIYHLMVDKPLIEAMPSIYWCTFGFAYVAIKYKAWDLTKGE